MPFKEQHSLQIRAEAFNLTGRARFDVNQHFGARDEF
jgi:hypothetical protein